MMITAEESAGQQPCPLLEDSFSAGIRVLLGTAPLLTTPTNHCPPTALAACLWDSEEKHAAHKLRLCVDAHDVSGSSGAGAVGDALKRGRRLAVLAAHSRLQRHDGGGGTCVATATLKLQCHCQGWQFRGQCNLPSNYVKHPAHPHCLLSTPACVHRPAPRTARSCPAWRGSAAATA